MDCPQRTRKRPIAGELANQDTKCEHVGPGVARLALQLLRRHVARRANQEPRLCHLDRGSVSIRPITARQPEVENLDAAVHGAHHVLGLEIPVCNAVRVRSGERRGNVACRLQDIGWRRTCAACDFLSQRSSVDILRGDEQIAVIFLERVDGADARMRQPRRSPRFAPQPLAMCRISGEPWRDGLEREVAAEACIGGEINPSHPAPPKLADDRVRADHAPGFEGIVFFEQ